MYGPGCNGARRGGSQSRETAEGRYRRVPQAAAQAMTGNPIDRRSEPSAARCEHLTMLLAVLTKYRLARLLQRYPNATKAQLRYFFHNARGRRCRARADNPKTFLPHQGGMGRRLTVAEPGLELGQARAGVVERTQHQWNTTRPDHGATSAPRPRPSAPTPPGGIRIVPRLLRRHGSE